MKSVILAAVGLFVVALVVSLGNRRLGQMATVKADAPAVTAWHVSPGYTRDNKLVPSTMMATAESADGTAEISIRCSPGFAAVYVRPPADPKTEAGTETATFTGSVDGAPEVVGHAMRVGRNLVVGGKTLLQQMKGGNVYRVRYTPYDGEEPATVMFDLRGLPVAIAGMNGSCGSF